MDYEFISKIGLVTGLYFFVNYFYKNTDWHSSTKNEKKNLQYYIKYLLILFFGLTLFCSAIILSMIFLKELLNYFEKISYWEQIGLSLGLIILYFYGLILKDGKKIKADKQLSLIEKQHNEILHLEKKIKTLEIKN
ncbi:hypothetical protein [Flavobacterium sp. Root420]|uniref:hypothetical protein n=1 Tax=Flavobacterium sp. Root420 TaxID=1736533 RepID=UPI0006F620BF|nr:hypothetical protein [Flavobacterium sp. Root420]KQX15907.1 hypothetical protein ASC72_03275 [Flavobacterium sp. Root420]